MREMMARMGILGELLSFLWKRKLYWLIPMILLLIVFAVFIILQSNPVTAPFIYSLF
jgi:Family of unknown function (DUF5989)